MPDFKEIADAWDELMVMRGAHDAIGTLAQELAQEIASDRADTGLLRRLQREFALRLVEWAANTPDVVPGDAWQQFLVLRILDGAHTLGQKASVTEPAKLGASLLEMAGADLARLRILYELTSANLTQVFQDLGLSPPPSFDDGVVLDVSDMADPLLASFHTATDWTPLLQPLLERFHREGAGPLSRCPAFRWDAEQGLVGIPNPDPITLDDLVGYEYPREALIRNTEQFLAGLPCNNILLYGARGTGKSSLIKALLNAYKHQGLRLVEVAREDMRLFPQIVRDLRGRPQRFILFADDLSYDDSELHYRELKAALEGTVEGRPDNVLLYATSNRRHLVKERFRDREAADDEIHAHDTVQEKLSLSDRFGLTLSFAPPTQAEYLNMVESIARRRGLAVPDEDLRAAALRWSALHNIPSGRTARQFIDDLEGSRKIGLDPQR